MGIFLALTIVSINPSSGIGLNASFGYEPALLARGEPLYSAFIPYGNYYLNNRGSAKVGISFAGVWSARGVFGVAGSYFLQGPAVIDLDGWYSCYRYTDIKSIEFSAGAEAAYALRFRPGKGEVFAGLEAVWGRFDCLGLYMNNDSPYDYRTLSYLCRGSGIQGWLGINYPLARLGRFALNVSTVFKGGGLLLRPDPMTVDYSWVRYNRRNPLSRWGVSAGLSLAYDSRVSFDTSRLFDARLRPNPKRSSYCCLFAAADVIGTRYSGGTLVLGKILQTTSAVVMGPLTGSLFALWGAAMSYDNSYGSEVHPLSWGCYLWAPVGSVLGTMWTGRYFNPGGDWKYTILGACLGNIANLFLAEGFIIATGGSPWRWGPDGNPFDAEGPPDGTYEVMIAGSLLPAAGALIGYNLSIKHLQDTLGLQPSWTQYALEQSKRNRLDKKALIGFDLVRLEF